MRDDKEKVMEILFSLFEKHQFYNIKVKTDLFSILVGWWFYSFITSFYEKYCYPQEF